MTPSQPLDRRSLVLAALSTVVEWYDFTLYLYLATVLSRVFFPGDGAVLTTLAGFAVAYLMRPLGAMVFGHFGDRHGRRATLLASMTLMTAAMLLTALLPTAAQAGPAAGLLLTIAFDAAVYTVTPAAVRLPALLPSLPYSFVVEVEATDPSAPPGTLRVYVSSAASSLPVLTASVQMCASQFV